MRTLIAVIAFIVAVVTGSRAGFASLSPTTCAMLAAEIPAADVGGQPPLRRRDTVVFNHTMGQLEWPSPAKLLVRDGDIFVIVFKDTDSTLFDYSLSPLGLDLIAKGVDMKADGQSVSSIRWDTVCVSWRYDRDFPLYRVAVTRRVPAKPSTEDTAAALKTAAKLATGDLQTQLLNVSRQFRLQGEFGSEAEFDRLLEMAKSQPNVLPFVERAAEGRERNLFPYTFPVWIEASDATMGFSSGFGFSDVVSDRFFVKKDTKGTADASDDTETVEKDAGKNDSFRPDLMAFATLTAPRSLAKSDANSWRNRRSDETWWSGRLGLTFGVGIGDESEPRYFFGPSLLLGRQFLLTLGAFGGKVDRLPAGQELGKAPISGSNTLAQLGSRFDTGLGVGFAWTFGAKAKENFLSALNPPQTVPEAPAPAAPAAVPGKVEEPKVEDTGTNCQLTWQKPEGAGESTEYVIYQVGKDEAVGTTMELVFKFKVAVAKDTEFQVVAKNPAGAAERSDKAKAANGCKPAA